ncbi:MAG: thioredoxin-like domain-containing protein, partial [Actinomycetota bacterium]
MNRILPLLALLLLAAACAPSREVAETPVDLPTATLADTSSPSAPPVESFAGTVDAPEFPSGLDWINTAQPITLNSLKGKVVLLDFWTYGCINCVHVIPDLERLEAEYPDELVVIGVHSAKFANEGDTAQITEIVQRYGLEHPVVNDSDFTVWNTWGVNAWPTVALIDPAGRVVGIRAGEGVYDAVEPVIAGLVAEFDAADAIDRTPIEFALESDDAPTTALRYPGKVLASDGRLWVSDTGHNRIVEVDPSTGEVLAAYGSGAAGSNDGTALDATFNAPQGLAHHADILYVADTNNHLIRAIDLATNTVSTIAGTGTLGFPAQSGPVERAALNSPWAVVHDSGTLYVANAGSHQIVSIDLLGGFTLPLVGSARESTTNGSFSEAALAQPSGLALSDEGILYFADSESSSIRSADLTNRTTSLVVGSDKNLFTFGDKDGQGNNALLQHPLGTALGDEVLYVADTYNSKIKRVDVPTSTVTSWLGSAPGWSDGPTPRFNEPGGLSYMDGVLYVADTNNHVIRVIDVSSGATSTLVLKGIEKFDPPAAFSGDVIRVDATAANAGEASLVIDYVLPAGYKVNEDAPSTISIADNGGLASLGGSESFDLTGTRLPAVVPVQLSEGSGVVTFDIILVYCEQTAT